MSPLAMNGVRSLGGGALHSDLSIRARRIVSPCSPEKHYAEK